MKFMYFSKYILTLFPFLPSGNFFNNWLSLIIYYPLGFLIFIFTKKLYEENIIYLFII